MIPVDQQPEPAHFDRLVRRPGGVFLTKNPLPAHQEFDAHSYWRKVREDMFLAYSGRCAYTSQKIMNGGCIDHFLPKSKYPKLAYEWSNLRLTTGYINQAKGSKEGIIDPFKVKIGWFTLDLPSCLIFPSPELDIELRGRVNSTISILRLNSPDFLVQARCYYLIELAQRKITLEFLDDFFPFLSAEIRRQQVESSLASIFSIGSNRKV